MTRDEGPEAASPGPLLGREKATILAGVAGSVLLLDLLSKILVRRVMFPGQSAPVIGDLVRLTYVLNPGAAFGIHVGEHSRVVLLGVALVILGFLSWMFLVTHPRDRLTLHAIALVVGGAVGNLLDRATSPSGVTDFIDVGLAAFRWPVFNVADIAITTGAILLLVAIWQGERRKPGDG
jgi:signal peptidase II